MEEENREEGGTLPVTIEDGTTVPHLVHCCLVGMDGFESKASQLWVKEPFIILEFKFLW